MVISPRSGGELATDLSEGEISSFEEASSAVLANGILTQCRALSDLRCGPIREGRAVYLGAVWLSRAFLFR